MCTIIRKKSKIYESKVVYLYFRVIVLLGNSRDFLKNKTSHLTFKMVSTKTIKPVSFMIIWIISFTLFLYVTFCHSVFNCHSDIYCKNNLCIYFYFVIYFMYLEIKLFLILMFQRNQTDIWSTISLNLFFFVNVKLYLKKRSTFPCKVITLSLKFNYLLFFS